MAKEIITVTINEHGEIIFSVDPKTTETSEITLMYYDDDWYRTEKISIALIMALMRDRVTSIRKVLPNHNVTQIIVNQDLSPNSVVLSGRTVLNKTDLSALTRRYLEDFAVAFPDANVEFECSESWLKSRINIDTIKGTAYPVKYDDIQNNAIHVGDYVCASGMAKARGSDPFLAPWRWLRPVKVIAIGGINGNDITVEESNGSQVVYPQHVITKFNRIDYTPVAGGRLVCESAPGRKMPLYGNSTSVDSDESICVNNLYFYDGEAVNYKYRVVIGKDDVGRTPPNKYSAGWVSENDLAMYGITQVVEE